MEKRPNLDENISIKDFQEFYWLKAELLDFCRKVGLKRTGSKIEITENIHSFLSTGQKPTTISKPKLASKFDWNNASLSLQTQITDNYKNTENVRLFFEKEVGQSFKFNVKFMKWMKTNQGKTLEAALEEWNRIKVEKKNNIQAKSIEPQFENNTYLRDFLADNPNSERSLGIQLWKIKKTRRGHNQYEQTDLDFL